MPILTQDTQPGLSLTNDDVAVVFACGVNWQYHLLNDPDGTKLYGSEQDLRDACPGVRECGIVELEVRVRRWVQPQDIAGLNTTPPPPPSGEA